MPHVIITTAAILSRPRARWGLALAWTALVIVLMWWPSMKTPPTFLGELTDKVGHFVVFGLFGALWLRVLDAGPAKPSQSAQRRLWLALGGCLAFSLVTELGQAFVPGREVALGDLAANWSGVGLGVAVMAFIFARR